MPVYRNYGFLTLHKNISSGTRVTSYSHRHPYCTIHKVFQVRYCIDTIGGQMMAAITALHLILATENGLFP